MIIQSTYQKMIPANTQPIQDQISFQTIQIVTNLKQFQEIRKSISTLLNIQNENNLSVLSESSFSRISVENIIKCNFCTKQSYYQDVNNNYYCWFHRANLE